MEATCLLSLVRVWAPCYLVNTLFKDSRGHLVPVQQLQPFMYLNGADGEALKVMSLIRYPEEQRQLIEVHAGGTNLVCTASRRAMAIKGQSRMASKTHQSLPLPIRPILAVKYV